MKKKQKDALRTKPDSELAKQIAQVAEDLEKTYMTQEHEKNTNAVKNLKRTLARLKTFQKEQQLAKAIK